MTVTTPAEAPPPLRLDFLDGLRGLAALYVAIFHSLVFIYLDLPATPAWARLALRPFTYGHYAVAVFIVLSGFCLMLPIVRTPDGRLRGGWRDYLRRRARRILPPYYAAFGIAAVLAVVSGRLKHHLGVSAEGTHLTPGVIVSHLLLIHNWSPHWNKAVDSPLWSVATEWQIYFFLPFVLLPLWRRAGVAAAAAVALGLGLAPHFLLPAAWNFDWACPWYLGLFGFGLAGAVISTGADPKMKALRARLPWGLLTCLLSVAFCVTLAFAPDVQTGRGFAATESWPLDVLCGAIMTCFLIYRTDRSRAGVARMTGLLETRPVTFLGAMSYSLYLMHVPLLQRPVSLLCARHAPFTVILAATVLVALPLTIGLCYLFHVVCERPFMAGRPRTGRQAEKSALLSPAP